MTDHESARTSASEADRHTSEHITGHDNPLIIDAEEFEAAQRDPKVIEFWKEAREEGERWEKTEWGYRLKAEQVSIPKRGITLVRNLGKIAATGDFGELLATALRRIF